MNTLVQTGLEFETVEEEIDRQARLLGEELFITYIAEALGELREQHGVALPLTDYVQERSEEAYEQLEILMEIQEESASTEELVEETGIDEEMVRDRIDRLREMGRIQREDGYWVAQEEE